MSLRKRQLPFLRSLIRSSNRNIRKDILKRANKDQINAINEVTLNLLKNNIPISPITMARLRPYKTTLRRLGNHNVSLKKRRRALQNHRGGRFWSGLGAVIRNCCG